MSDRITVPLHATPSLFGDCVRQYLQIRQGIELQEQRHLLRWQRWVDPNSLILKDHQVSLLTTRDFEGFGIEGDGIDRALDKERKAKNLACVRLLLKFSVLSAVTMPVLLGKIFGIRVPLFNSDMSAWKWGALAGITCNWLFPIMAVGWVAVSARRIQKIVQLATVGVLSFGAFSMISWEIKRRAQGLQRHALEVDRNYEGMANQWKTLGHYLLFEYHQAVRGHLNQQAYDQLRELLPPIGSRDGGRQIRQLLLTFDERQLAQLADQLQGRLERLAPLIRNHQLNELSTALYNGESGLSTEEFEELSAHIHRSWFFALADFIEEERNGSNHVHLELLSQQQFVGWCKLLDETQRNQLVGILRNDTVPALNLDELSTNTEGYSTIYTQLRAPGQLQRFQEVATFLVAVRNAKLWEGVDENFRVRANGHNETHLSEVCALANAIVEGRGHIRLLYGIPPEFESHVLPVCNRINRLHRELASRGEGGQRHITDEPLANAAHIYATSVQKLQGWDQRLTVLREKSAAKADEIGELRNATAPDAVSQDLRRLECEYGAIQQAIATLTGAHSGFYQTSEQIAELMRRLCTQISSPSGAEKRRYESLARRDHVNWPTNEECARWQRIFELVQQRTTTDENEQLEQEIARLTPVGNRVDLTDVQAVASHARDLSRRKSERDELIQLLIAHAAARIAQGDSPDRIIQPSDRLVTLVNEHDLFHNVSARIARLSLEDARAIHRQMLVKQRELQQPVDPNYDHVLQRAVIDLVRVRDALGSFHLNATEPNGLVDEAIATQEAFVRALERPEITESVQDPLTSTQQQLAAMNGTAERMRIVTTQRRQCIASMLVDDEQFEIAHAIARYAQEARWEGWDSVSESLRLLTDGLKAPQEFRDEIFAHCGITNIASPDQPQGVAERLAFERHLVPTTADGPEPHILLLIDLYLYSKNRSQWTRPMERESEQST